MGHIQSISHWMVASHGPIIRSISLTNAIQINAMEMEIALKMEAVFVILVGKVKPVILPIVRHLTIVMEEEHVLQVLNAIAILDIPDQAATNIRVKNSRIAMDMELVLDQTLAPVIRDGILQTVL